MDGLFQYILCSDPQENSWGNIPQHTEPPLNLRGYINISQTKINMYVKMKTSMSDHPLCEYAKNACDQPCDESTQCLTACETSTKKLNCDISCPHICYNKKVDYHKICEQTKQTACADYNKYCKQ